MPRPPIHLSLLLALLLALPACSSTPRPTEAANPATLSPVPVDFWISAIILGPVRSGGTDGVSAYDALPRPLHPGRYIVEPDRSLHVALGVGAKQPYYPPQTRLLTPTEFAELWHIVQASDLLDPNSPNYAAGSGELDPETIKDKTIYVIDTHASGRRQMEIIEIEPDCGDQCAKAKRVVDWMAEKAWVQPPVPHEIK